MTNLAHKLQTRLEVAHKAPDSGLLALLMSAGFDKSRIVIAEHDLSDTCLTLWLEDKQDLKSNISETLVYELPVDEFEKVISAEKLNSYPGVKYTERGRAYEDDIEINEPIEWYEQDATSYQQANARESALSHILKSLGK